MIRRTVYYSGQVQGVGFRYTTHQAAASHPVTGYVRNLPDGRVELVVEGAAPDVEALLVDIRVRLGGFIGAQDEQESPATGEFRSFEVRR